MKKKEDSDEINLLEVFITIINNKIKIFLIAILTIAVAYGFQINESKKIKPKKFTTKFSTISITSETNQFLNNRFDLGETYEVIELNRFYLFDIFTAILKEEIGELVKKFNFIKREDYESEKSYLAAVNKIVLSITIAEIKKSSPREGIIELRSQDENITNKWINFLDTLEYSVNELTQRYLGDIINKRIEIAKLDRQNKIEDMESQKINLLNTHELIMNDKLVFLKEQAEIAREASIKGSDQISKELQKIFINPFALTSLYYMKGYDIIEKEIELIEKRKDTDNLEAQIVDLTKNKLKKNQDIIREETKIKKTSIFSNAKFLAGYIDNTSTEVIIESNNVSMSKMLIWASLIGLIIGILYVLISSSIHNAVKHNKNND